MRMRRKGDFKAFLSVNCKDPDEGNCEKHYTNVSLLFIVKPKRMMY